MKNFFLPGVLLLFLMAGCTAEQLQNGESPTEGAVRFSLSQENPETKSELVEDDLPSLDDFEVEIYNARALRLYRDTYAQTKDATIKLNAGEFRLVAHHGDTLGAGFNKPYFLAEKEFTVHGYVENGGEPDHVEAVARLANVRMSVVQGNNLLTSYKNAYVVVRHSRYSKKQVKFVRNESRYGYMPGGDLYLEVYAQLFTDEWKYYKSEAVEYLPNDNVTFNVDAAGRDGTLTVNITVDRSVETIEVDELIGEKALPARAPYFVFDGDKGGVYTYSCNTGFVKTVSDAILTLSAGASTHISSMTLHTESTSVNLPDVDLVSVSGADKQSLLNAGLDWMAGTTSNLGYVDFSGLVNKMIASGVAGSASFTFTLTDGVNQQVSGSFSLNVTPFAATVNIPEGNIWAWKMTGVTATVAGVEEVPADATLGLQWSTDGSNWSTEKAAVSASGNTVQFGDITGLTPATGYRFRVVPMHLTDRASATAGTFTTEADLQVGNNGFEDITAQSYTTPVALASDFKVTWWQLYKNASSAWWGVNALQTIETGKVAATYQDYKTYPCVAVFESGGAYSGKSVMLATVYMGNSVASEASHGSTNYPGEIFLGVANNQNKGSWAKTTNGHAFTSRPSALSFMHRFNPNGAAYYVLVQVLDASGQVIGSAEKNDGTSAVDAWTRITLPITYTATNRKAASLRISIRSSRDGGEGARKLSNISTLSGTHKIYCGNALYVDNVELLYQ